MTNITVANCLGGGILLKGGKVGMVFLFCKEVGKASLTYINGWSGVMNGTFILNTYPNFDAAICGEGIDKLPTFHDVHCISIVGGKALVLKDNSGIDISNIIRSGYQINEEFNGVNNVSITGLGVVNFETFRFNWANMF